MTTGYQIAVNFKIIYNPFCFKLGFFLSMITFCKNVIIFLIGIFFGCHVTKNGRFLKIKKYKN